MFDAISQVGEELKKNQLVRVIILTGAGSDFCSGLDTSTFTQWASDFEKVRNNLTMRPVGENANWFHNPCYEWQEIEVPVIAAIKGVLATSLARIRAGNFDSGKRKSNSPNPSRIIKARIYIFRSRVR